jgi:hypothetical protein
VGVFTHLPMIPVRSAVRSAICNFVSFSWGRRAGSFQTGSKHCPQLGRIIFRNVSDVGHQGQIRHQAFVWFRQSIGSPKDSESLAILKEPAMRPHGPKGEIPALKRHGAENISGERLPAPLASPEPPWRAHLSLKSIALSDDLVGGDGRDCRKRQPPYEGDLQ